MDCLDCVETTARLHLYIDRELNDEEIEIVQMHLEECPHCQYRFYFDMHVKRLIHDRCTIQHAPSRLREAVLLIARTPQGKFAEIDPELATELRADLEGHE
ncbi:MAG TPA: mycothiol system anti-sigma-R factor [Ktedonobacteraceae bacterium]|jgi:mycothiol system anti-sigma-R factor|nr:mycothiol system anti-sigma-R factor [Ktedonobacteraceae bacterium]